MPNFYDVNLSGTALKISEVADINQAGSANIIDNIYDVNLAGSASLVYLGSKNLGNNLSWDFSRGNLSPYEDEMITLLTMTNTATLFAGYSTLTISGSWSWSVLGQGTYNHSMKVDIQGWNLGGWYEDWNPGVIWSAYENFGGSSSVSAFTIPVSTLQTQTHTRIRAWHRRDAHDGATQMRFTGTLSSVILTA